MVSEGFKLALDKGGDPQEDWIPAAGLSGVSLMMHGRWIFQGGENSRDALIETGFEATGAFLPVILDAVGIKL
jgi:hypothetical protein